MLTIRSEQMHVFSLYAEHAFMESTLAHLHRFFPQKCRRAGDAELRALIKHGIGRAARHGIESGPDVRRYVDLMMVLGRDFDSDPRYPWAREILSIYHNPSTRLHFLHRATKNHLQNRALHASRSDCARAQF